MAAANETLAFVEFERDPEKYLKAWLEPLLSHLSSGSVYPQHKRIILEKLQKLKITNMEGALDIEVDGLMVQLHMFSQHLDSISDSPDKLPNGASNNIEATPVKPINMANENAVAGDIVPVEATPVYTLPIAALSLSASNPPSSHKKAALARLRSPVSASASFSAPTDSLIEADSARKQLSELNIKGAKPLPFLELSQLFELSIKMSGNFSFHHAYLNLLQEFLSVLHEKCLDEATDDQKAQPPFSTLLTMLQDETIAYILASHAEIIDKPTELTELKDIYDSWFNCAVGNGFDVEYFFEIFNLLPSQALKMWFIECLHDLKIYFYAEVVKTKGSDHLKYSFKASPALALATQRISASDEDAALMRIIHNELQVKLRMEMPQTEPMQSDGSGVNLSNRLSNSSVSLMRRAPSLRIVLFTPPRGKAETPFFDSPVGETPRTSRTDARSSAGTSSGGSMDRS